MSPRMRLCDTKYTRLFARISVVNITKEMVRRQVLESEKRQESRVFHDQADSKRLMTPALSICASMCGATGPYRSLGKLWKTSIANYLHKLAS